MKTTLSNIGGYHRDVEIRPIAALEQTFHLEFSSRLNTSKNPLESKKNFDLLLSRPDGHPNSPACGHLKFPHPERDVTMG